MSAGNLARRTEIKLVFDGVDISTEANRYLLSMSYSDNESDKTDDLELTLDDREGVWLQKWLNPASQKVGADQPEASDNTGWAVGDSVIVNGTPQYTSQGGKPGAPLADYQGKITHLNLKNNAPYPIHVDQKGWFAQSEVSKQGAAAAPEGQRDIKGLTMSAAVIQRNWQDDGKDSMLDCGSFEIDSIEVSGPPSVVSIRGTSIANAGNIRGEKHSRAWENLRLSAIAAEIATAGGMECLYESGNDPLYKRAEQLLESNIVFLQRLCTEAGINLKATGKLLVLFDAAAYEEKSPATAITAGKSNVKSYRFGTNFNDTAYSKCHVSYTNPETGQLIEYTYTPREDAGNGQTLEINEKVNNREEARQLAMKRLRQKNKAEYSAEFTLMGDVGLVAGVTVAVSGYGFFDGKYIIETAAHRLTGGYEVQLNLRKVLEGY